MVIVEWLELKDSSRSAKLLFLSVKSDWEDRSVRRGKVDSKVAVEASRMVMNCQFDPSASFLFLYSTTRRSLPCQLLIRHVDSLTIPRSFGGLVVPKSVFVHLSLKRLPDYPHSKMADQDSMDHWVDCGIACSSANVYSSIPP